ncbi:protein kinase [Halomicrobium sp. IBSBa]|uniref:FHA domain-containing serine/threonine-protein kinase n=1 Tax=Halomicrobium sp. IBSBa TaxID=2778916 RepID=UPI001ABF135C|nr:FHA domain-containing serine/threonine-protein kinase [Halomicrobium sp. IBSBa]MBO4246913.1 protein kinase [Halomicrobium sp. IBSBa]
MTTFEAGDLVAGQYRVQGEAGSGGFAVAYEAIDEDSGDTVAVKVPNYAGSSNDRDVIEQYFLKEADALETVRAAGGNDNVMDLIERTDEGDTPVLVVQFVDGYELDDAIDQVGPLDPAEVRRVGIGLCDAMSFLHENDIVYRDLKPDNIMLAGQDHPILIDFNTATGFDGTDADDAGTTILGPYKPREIAEASDAEDGQGPWSDVYSIGKILLFLLKGTVPKKDGVDPRDFGVDCPTYLAEIIARATQTDYRDRYPNATSMKYVLEAKDPSPPPQASLEALGEDRSFTIHPGDTIGRDGGATTPSITLEDADEHVSPIHVRFDTSNDEAIWRLEDHSLNGTYVNTQTGWQRLLQPGGKELLEARGGDPTDRNGEDPPSEHALGDGDLIALVHPSYGTTFEFNVSQT